MQTDKTIVISAQMIEKLLARDFRDKETLVFAKRLLRSMISHYAGETALNTRRILQQLRRL